MRKLTLVALFLAAAVVLADTSTTTFNVNAMLLGSPNTIPVDLSTVQEVVKCGNVYISTDGIGTIYVNGASTGKTINGVISDITTKTSTTTSGTVTLDRYNIACTQGTDGSVYLAVAVDFHDDTPTYYSGFALYKVDTATPSLTLASSANGNDAVYIDSDSNSLRSDVVSYGSNGIAYVYAKYDSTTSIYAFYWLVDDDVSSSNLESAASFNPVTGSSIAVLEGLQAITVSNAATTVYVTAYGTDSGGTTSYTDIFAIVDGSASTLKEASNAKLSIYKAYVYNSKAYVYYKDVATNAGKVGYLTDPSNPDPASIQSLTDVTLNVPTPNSKYLLPLAFVPVSWTIVTTSSYSSGSVTFQSTTVSALGIAYVDGNSLTIGLTSMNYDSANYLLPTGSNGPYSYYWPYGAQLVDGASSNTLEIYSGTSVYDVELTASAAPSLQDLSNLYAYLDYQISQLTATLGNIINNYLTPMKSTLDTVSSTVADISTTLSSIESTVNNIDTTTSNIYNYLQNTINPALSDIKSDVQTLVSYLGQPTTGSSDTVFSLLYDINTNIQSIYNEITNTIEPQLNNIYTAANTAATSANSLQSEVIDVKNLVGNLQNTVDDISTTVNNINAQVTSIADIVNDINSATTDIQSSINLALQKINDVSSQISTVQSQLSTIQSQLNAMQNFLNNINTTVYKNLDALNIIRSNLNNIGDTLETVKSTVLQVSDTVNDVNGTTSQILDNIDMMLSNINSINNTLTTAIDNLNNLNTIIQSVMNQIKSLNATVVQYQTQLNETMKTLEEYYKLLSGNITDINNALQKIETKCCNTVTTTVLVTTTQKSGIPGVALLAPILLGLRRRKRSINK